MNVIKCPKCKGEGAVQKILDYGDGTGLMRFVACPECHGSKVIFTDKIPMKIKLDPDATMPTRAHTTDAGLDLYAAENVRIWPHSWKAVETGVHVAIPKGYVGLLTSKSGLMRHNGLTCRGTIDSGYTGTIQAVMFNHSDVHVQIPKGNKVTQLVILPIITPELELVDELEETDRGDGGFGSTGR